MFRCLLVTRVETPEGHGYGLRLFDLPFVPHAGLRINGGVSGSSLNTVRHATWVHKKRLFYVAIMQDENIYLADKDLPPGTASKGTPKELLEEQWGDDWVYAEDDWGDEDYDKNWDQPWVIDEQWDTYEKKLLAGH